MLYVRLGEVAATRREGVHMRGMGDRVAGCSDRVGAHLVGGEDEEVRAGHEGAF